MRERVNTLWKRGYVSCLFDITDQETDIIQLQQMKHVCILGTQVAQLAISGLPNDIKLRQHTGNKFIRFRPVHRDLLLIVPLDLNEEEDEVITLAISCDTMNISVRTAHYIMIRDRLRLAPLSLPTRLPF